MAGSKKLGEKMSPWAGGRGGAYILSVSSHWYGGHSVPREWVEGALREFNAMSSNVPSDREELRAIRAALRKKLGLRANAPTDCGRVTPTFNRYQGKQVSLYGDSWTVAGCDDRRVKGEGTARLKSKTRTGRKGRPIVKVVAKRRLRDAAFQGRGGIKPRKRTRR
jgi:hypothetical protein